MYRLALALQVVFYVLALKYRGTLLTKSVSGHSCQTAFFSMDGRRGLKNSELGNLGIQGLGDYINTNTKPSHVGCERLKRIFDFVAVCLGLAMISPIMAITAILIKGTSLGHIFFRQDRVGWKEKKFRAYKFRTMVERAEEMGTSVTTKNDPRITSVGRILRNTKLDELPQLINVFKGDMSLVGPRPDVPEIVENYSAEMRRVFLVRPGITSITTLHLKDEEGILAKVNDPDTFYEKVLVPLKVKLAMEHVDRSSFAFDLKVLCQTVWMLTLGRWLPIEEHPAVAELKKRLNPNVAKVEDAADPRRQG